ncbi:MAG: thiamine diphosphokinase [Ilumatobacteraceae bacterium]
MTETVIVITGAAALDRRALAALPGAALIVAADGGLDHALAAGLRPAVLVGDLDSISPDGLVWAHDHAEVLTHPTAKDDTDTELALAHALTYRPSRIVLVAGPGDRFDHAVTAIGALGASAFAGVRVLEAWSGADHLRVVHGPGCVTLDLPTGTTFSVVAMHGTCEGVDVTGARWPLRDCTLRPLAGLGVSNEAADPPTVVAVRRGVLTVIVPGTVA